MKSILLHAHHLKVCNTDTAFSNADIMHRYSLFKIMRRPLSQIDIYHQNMRSNLNYATCTCRLLLLKCNRHILLALITASRHEKVHVQCMNIHFGKQQREQNIKIFH